MITECAVTMTCNRQMFEAAEDFQRFLNPLFPSVVVLQDLASLEKRPFIIRIYADSFEQMSLILNHYLSEFRKHRSI